MENGEKANRIEEIKRQDYHFETLSSLVYAVEGGILSEWAAKKIYVEKYDKVKTGTQDAFNFKWAYQLGILTKRKAERMAKQHDCYERFQELMTDTRKLKSLKEKKDLINYMFDTATSYMW